jgi:hypothetical protein
MAGIFEEVHLERYTKLHNVTLEGTVLLFVDRDTQVERD